MTWIIKIETCNHDIEEADAIKKRISDFLQKTITGKELDDIKDTTFLSNDRKISISIKRG